MHRNVANTVPANDTETSTVLQYAINNLGVKDIVISGHTYCGGINAVLSGYDRLDRELKRWLAPVNEIYLKNKQTIDLISDPLAKSRKLAELNVLSVAKIVSELHPVLEARSRDIPINIHTLLYELDKGTFFNLNTSF
ncbi:Carbonic anhydrase [Smittium culicis]|uniref:Carbonic anhydrase n=1 Tax=Smittium culicis TaxID=133412 RepID=A0A1R1Y1P8_9FUNG|nr:Carbonic anhydrase [Smittium culicis]